ncbi:acyl-CoA N-acyltransferase [Aspergillus varians]
MHFSLQPVLPTDAPRITDIYFAAFTNNLSQRIMPETDDVRIFKTAAFEKAAEDAQSEKPIDFVKVVSTAPDQDPVIVAFAMWKYFDGDSDGEDGGSKLEWPTSSDGDLCDSFFSRVDRERKQAIGDQPHYYLNMLAVDPAFGHRGLGAMLLQWGLDRADQQRCITFISASPAGRGLYEKHGCRAVSSYEVIPGYHETSMVRPVAGLSRG